MGRIVCLALVALSFGCRASQAPVRIEPGAFSLGDDAFGLQRIVIVSEINPRKISIQYANLIDRDQRRIVKNPAAIELTWDDAHRAYVGTAVLGHRLSVAPTTAGIRLNYLSAHRAEVATPFGEWHEWLEAEAIRALSETLETLAGSIELYAAKNGGALPEALSDIEDLGFEKISNDPWGRPLVYRVIQSRRRQAHFRLFSTGPDGVPDTEDDVEVRRTIVASGRR